VSGARFLSRFPPLLVFTLVAAAMAGVAQWLPAAGRILPGRGWIVTVLVTLGAVIALAGVVQLRIAATTVDPRYPERASMLVRTGVYRVTRNPMYLGLALVLLGWATWLVQPVAWVGPLAFVLWIDRVQIALEERAMRARFGAAFTEYCRRTRRWI
jgi:protein-S-isoprenylcysteine O-methyltransferase Ste14